MTPKLLEDDRTPTPVESVRRLLEAAIDYAGLFLPAGLPMPAAIQEYAVCRSGPFAWMLGRMVIPVSRLEEFALALDEGPSAETEDAVWQASAIASSNVAADVAAVLKFNSRNTAAREKHRAMIDSIELKVQRPEEVHTAARHIPPQLSTFFELPLAGDVHGCISAAQECRGFAKVRTGGTKVEQFPSCAALAGFIQLAVGLHAPFKATAGLHHAIRGAYPIAGEQGGASVVMHGFLNLLIAIALSRAGGSAREVTATLEEQDAKAFSFTTDGAQWHAYKLSNEQLTEARRRSIRSWGSCSINEPVEDLRAIHLL
jgi:hypothetical protein